MDWLTSWMYSDYNSDELESLRFSDPAKYLKLRRRKRAFKKYVHYCKLVGLFLLILGIGVLAFYHSANSGWPFKIEGCEKTGAETAPVSLDPTAENIKALKVCDELGMFTCEYEKSGSELVRGFQCLNKSLVCNGIDDCLNGYDENGCLRLSTPAQISSSVYNKTESEGYVYMKADSQWYLYCDKSKFFLDNGLKICQYLKFTRLAASRIESLEYMQRKNPSHDLKSKILGNNHKKLSKLNVHGASSCEVFGYIVCE